MPHTNYSLLILSFLMLIGFPFQHQELFSNAEYLENSKRSKYALNIYKDNVDPSTEIFLPSLELELEYEVISDGIRSFITIQNRSNFELNGIHTQAETVFAYTNCEKGIGMELDSIMNVENLYKIKPRTFMINENEEIIIMGQNFIASVWDCSKDVNMKIFTSKIISQAVNSGTCYPVDGGMLKMKGQNLGVRIEFTLISTESCLFDFKPYDELLQKHEHLAQKELDLFWN